MEIIEEFGLILVFFQIGIIACFEFCPMENYNGLNGTFSCPTLFRLKLESEERVVQAGVFSRVGHPRSIKLWLSTDRGRIHIMGCKDAMFNFSKKVSQTQKMSYNPNRQSNFLFDFDKVENYNVKNYHLMSQKINTAQRLQQVKVQNDFIVKNKQSQRLNMPKPSRKFGQRFNFRNLNIECIYYDIKSAVRFPWALDHSFHASKAKAPLIKTVFCEQVLVI